MAAPAAALAASVSEAAEPSILDTCVSGPAFPEINDKHNRTVKAEPNLGQTSHLLVLAKLAIDHHCAAPAFAFGAGEAFALAFGAGSSLIMI